MKALLSLLLAALISSAAQAQTVEEWQQRAATKYPDLAVADSPLNKAFRAQIPILKKDVPYFFEKADWPMRLAEDLNRKLAKPKAEPARPEQITGRVVSHAKEGLLIRRTSDQRLILLRGHPEQADLVDEDLVMIEARPNGTFQFTAAIGNVVTVRAYDAIH